MSRRSGSPEVWITGPDGASCGADLPDACLSYGDEAAPHGCGDARRGVSGRVAGRENSVVRTTGRGRGGARWGRLRGFVTLTNVWPDLERAWATGPALRSSAEEDNPQYRRADFDLRRLAPRPVETETDLNGSKRSVELEAP